MKCKYFYIYQQVLPFWHLYSSINQNLCGLYSSILNSYTRTEHHWKYQSSKIFNNCFGKVFLSSKPTHKSQHSQTYTPKTWTQQLLWMQAAKPWQAAVCVCVCDAFTYENMRYVFDLPKHCFSRLRSKKCLEYINCWFFLRLVAWKMWFLRRICPFKLNFHLMCNRPPLYVFLALNGFLFLILDWNIPKHNPKNMYIPSVALSL